MPPVQDNSTLSQFWSAGRKPCEEPVFVDALDRALKQRRAQEKVSCPMTDRNAMCYGKIFYPPAFADGSTCGKKAATKPVEPPPKA